MWSDRLKKRYPFVLAGLVYCLVGFAINIAAVGIGAKYFGTFLVVAGAYADHSLLPPGKYITMFQYLEYPASRGKIHIRSANPYVEPFFDSGFMNNKADFAPIRWSYKKTREVARRMDCKW